METSIASERERLTAEMAIPDSSSSSIVIKLRRLFPDFLQWVKLKYIRLRYHYATPSSFSPSTHLLLLPPTLVVLFATWWFFSLQTFFLPFLTIDPTAGLAVLAVLAALLTLFFLNRARPVYLVDFACAKPDEKQKITRQLFKETTCSIPEFNEVSADFQSKIIFKSGLGDETYVPINFFAKPPSLSMDDAVQETALVMYNAMDSLFKKTGVDPRQIDILIVNCSVLNPIPSLSSMIVNRYNMRDDVRSFNLGGMGCSAGLISVDLAKNLLIKSNRDSYAVVLSTENITVNWYFGNDRSMLLSNCIFRTGAGAALLSNKSSDRSWSKYRLVHTLRTHKGAGDQSYGCVQQKEDSEGKVGISLAKELMTVAGEALTANITTLGPLVLSMTEQFKFFATFVARKVLKMRMVKTYVPDFKKAFEHFCIHAGGRAVLDAMQKNLRLTDSHMEPSRMTLHRFGNTSSSSLWYELAYTEAKGRVKKGDRVWQIAFGSGFKCNSAVWRALREVQSVAAGDESTENPWADCVDRYPVKL